MSESKALVCKRSLREETWQDNKSWFAGPEEGHFSSPFCFQGPAKSQADLSVPEGNGQDHFFVPTICHWVTHRFHVDVMDNPIPQHKQHLDWDGGRRENRVATAARLSGRREREE